MNVDYRETNVQNVHKCKKIKFSPLVESSQSQLRGFFMSTDTSRRNGTTILESASDTSGISSDVIKCTPGDSTIQFSGGCTSITLESKMTESQPNVSSESDTERRDGDESELINANVDPMMIEQVKETMIVMDKKLDEGVMVLDKETPSAPDVMTDSTISLSPSPKIDNTPLENSVAETPTACDFPTSSTAVTSIGPNQPIQSECLSS